MGEARRKLGNGRTTYAGDGWAKKHTFSSMPRQGGTNLCESMLNVLGSSIRDRANPFTGLWCPRTVGRVDVLLPGGFPGGKIWVAGV
jgi:hypothetical protein